MSVTYRLQLHPGFTFDHARAIVPYLRQLGVTHLYLSPILQAGEGSTHGYDVVDPDRVSQALGGEAGFKELVDAVAQAGLGILLDIVPNHMSIAMTGGPKNRWWSDVLENGLASYYAHYFDVDWPPDDARISLPVLGERYGRSIANGAIGIVHDGAGGFHVRANDLRLPLSPRSLGPIVKRAGEAMGHAELSFVGDALSALPRSSDPEERRRRHRDKAVLQARLRELCADRAVASALDREVAALAADPGSLDAVLESQPFRLAHWSTAASQLTYRRFFDISTLVGLRQEEPDVFAACHARICGWLRDGAIAGVRVDHADGLRDPAGYVDKLRVCAPGAWIVVEKILAQDEALPPWRIEGTTGYEFADRMTRLLVSPDGEKPLTEAFEAYTGASWDPAAARRMARREVMSDALHSELTRLVDMAARACGQSPACRDYTRAEIQDALVEIFAGYRTYRTYLEPGSTREIDRERISNAVHAAAATGVDHDLLAYLEAALSFELPHPDAQALAATAQQVTGAIVAKGDEDTLAYRLVRLIARCEVGADISELCTPPAEIHAALAGGPPRGLLATATHDTKRGEDVRARIAVLSEVPQEWRAAVWRWRERAERGWGDVAPDRTLEYLVWQTLVGAWPIEQDRVVQYARKASKEARLRTSWRKPDDKYDAAMVAWIGGIYADRELTDDLGRFAASITPRGDANALAQLAIKLTAPGVPDLYQGCELRDDSLVDPDNRRAVDFEARRAAAEANAFGSDLASRKMWIIRRVLQLRQQRSDLFEAPYNVIDAVGPRSERVFAFMRGTGLVVAVPRVGSIDPETRLPLPPGRWRDALSPRNHCADFVHLAQIWGQLPVAILTSDD